MAAHHRYAFWLLLPINLLALGVGLAVIQGAVPLPAPPPSSFVAAPAPAFPLPPSAPARELHARRVAAAVLVPPVVATAPAPPPRRPARHASRARRVIPLSFEQEVQRQVTRIPFYRPELVHWVVRPGLANYGVTNLVTHTVYLSPRIPRRLIYSVVAHEWGHVISTRAYAGDLGAAGQAYLEWFGGASITVAFERAADCVAVILGARWTHYTSCQDSRWRDGARYLAVGWVLPREA